MHQFYKTKQLPRAIFYFTLLFFYFFTATTAAKAATYSEDFHSLDYADLSETTAEWNTRHGEISLPKSFQPSNTSLTDTSGQATDLIISGSYAYVADGTAGIKIFDISDTAAPSLIGSYSTSVTNIRRLALQETAEHRYLFLADNGSTNDVKILNIDDRTNPTLTSQIAIVNATAQELGVSGTSLYALANGSGATQDYIYSYDISTIAAPSQSDSMILSASGNQGQYGIQIIGDRLYAGQYTAGLNIINIADPTNLSSVGEYNSTPYGIFDLLVSGNYVYCVTTDHNLLVIDISDEGNPSLVTSTTTYSNGQGLYLSGTTLFVGTALGGVISLDISDPTQPARNSNPYRLTKNIKSVWVVGDEIFATADTAGFLVVDNSSPYSPTQEWEYNTGSSNEAAWDVEVRDNYAYVADAGLFIFDVTEPANPVFQGSNTTACTDTRGVEISGSYAYVTCATLIKVYDISNKTNPTYVNAITTGYTNRGFKLVGSTIYIGATSGGLMIYNISDPLNESFIGQVVTPGDAYGVDVDGDYAYIADFYNGITVVDISNPSSPQVVENYDPGGSAHTTVQKEGDYIFTGGISVFYILNASNPENLTTLSSITDDGYGFRKFTLSGNYLYTSSSFAGVNIFDISNLSSPTQIGAIDFEDTHSTYGIVSAYELGNYIFASGYGEPALYTASMKLQSSGSVQSDTVDAISESIAHATLTAAQTTPTNTSITYQLSADGGSHWETVTSGAEHDFTNTGSNLKWKAALSTTDTSKTPTIDSLSIDYETWRVPEQPTISVSDSSTQPDFSGSSYSGDLSHTSSSWEMYDASSLEESALAAYDNEDANNTTSVQVEDGDFTFQNALDGRDTLLPGTRYWVRVKYLNSQGGSNWSNAVLFITSDQIPETVAIPDQEWLEDNEETGPDLDMYFSDPDDVAMTYSILDSDNPAHISVDIENETHRVTFTPEANWFGTDTVTFQANDATNEKNSNSVTLTVENVNDAPEAPGTFDINNTTVSTLTPTLSWDAAEDIDNDSSELHYIVRISKQEDNIETNYLLQKTTADSVTSASINQELEEDTHYYYIVKTVDRGNLESSWSSAQSFYVNSEATPNITFTKSVENLSNVSYAHPWNHYIANNFFWQARAQSTQSSTSGVKSLSFIQNPLLTYFFLIAILLSFLCAPLVTKNLKKTFAIILLSPQKSFPKIAVQNKKGTWQYSYAKFAQKANVSRGIFFTSTVLLVTKIVIATLLSAYVLETPFPVASTASEGGHVDPGDQLRYSITYTNSGDGAATNVHILDILSENVTLVPHSINFKGETGLNPEDRDDMAFSNNTLDFFIPAISQDGVDGSEDTISFIVQIKTQIGRDATSITNTGTFSANEFESSLNSNTVQNNLPASYITGTVFQDDNQNSVQDASEESIASAKINLYQDMNNDGVRDASDRLMQTEITDINGSYEFYHLVQASYLAEVDTTSLAFEIDSIQPENPQTIAVTSRDTFMRENVDFGITQKTQTDTESEDTTKTKTGQEEETEEENDSNTPNANNTTNENTTGSNNESDKVLPPQIIRNEEGILVTLCEMLKLTTINDEPPAGIVYIFQDNEGINFKGKTCEQEKILVVIGGIESIIKAEKDGSWDFILEKEKLPEKNETITFKLVLNTDIYTSIELQKEQKSSAQKISNTITKPLQSIMKTFDNQITRNNNIHFEIPIFSLLFLLLAFLLYRIIKKYQEFKHNKPPQKKTKKIA